MSSRAKYIILGAGLYFLGVTGGILLFGGKSYKSKDELQAVLDTSDTHRMKSYDENADKFDGWLERPEKMLGIGKLREKLMQIVRKENDGDAKVLEIAVGTARNVEYYQVSNGTENGGKLVWTDQSAKMLDIAGRKAREKGLSVDLVQIGAERLTDKFSQGEFDCVIDTFGFCSLNDPMKSLEQMKAVCKPGGLLCFLEHGKSVDSWISGMLNWFMERNAIQHAHKYGCWWNRDIGALIDRSGLEVVLFETHKLGTTYLIVCRNCSKV